MWFALSDRYKKAITLLGFAVTLTVISIASYAYADYFSWTQVSSSPYPTSWSGVAVSSNGYVLAVRSDLDQYVYVSDNLGLSFSPSYVSSHLISFSTAAISVDGTHMMVGTSEGLYVSHNYGTSWNFSFGMPVVYDVAMSKSGQFQVLVGPSGILYTSAYYGDYVWTYKGGPIPSSARSNLKTADISDDGQKLVTAGTNTNIFISANNGVTWGQVGPSLDWKKVVMSGDGSVMAAITNGGYVYVSNDAGQDWSPIISLGMRAWSSVAISDNGSVMAVSASSPGGDGRYVYTSTDSGATWMPEDGAPAATLIQGVGLDNNGVRLFVASSNSYLYTGTDVRNPRLKGITATNNSGAYRAGVGSDSIIHIIAEFTEPVYVDPGYSLVLTLNSASAVPCSPYGTSGRFMVCDYVVPSNVNVTQLDVTGYAATDHIFDLAGNPLANIVANPPSYTLAGTKSIRIDNIPPLASSVTSTTTATSATITWTTNELASSTVEYGTSTGSRTWRSAVEPSLRTSHSATLSSLAASTTYYFVITSIDEAGNSYTSFQSTFKTADLPVVVPSASSTPRAIIAPQTPYASGGYAASGPFSQAAKPVAVVPSQSKPVAVSVGQSALNDQQKLLIKYPLSLKSNRKAFLNADGSVFQFEKSLGSYSPSGPDVKKLQVFLNFAGYPVAETGAGSIGRETSVFGPATRNALIMFQRAFGISPPNGNLGPATRAYVNSIIKQLWQ